jgi:DNA (cytosine-5)-methyltransferase 1
MLAQPTYTLIDVFAGCGGMTRGFVDSGRFEPVLAVEDDPDAAETYCLNHGSHIAVGPDGMPQPIEEISKFPRVDVVIGGPPCQAFSLLNRTGAGRERRGLWREYIRTLEQSGPSAFVMENVPQLISSREYRLFCGEAAALGYSIDARVLNAADYGVPQRRKRAIVIGMQNEGLYSWPEPTHGDPKSLPLGREPWQTFRDAVRGLSSVPDGENWHVGRNPRPESLIRYQAVPQDGGDRFQMQTNLDKQGQQELVLPCFRRKPTGTTDVFGRLWWDRPTVTIRTEFYKPEKGRYLHPKEHRALTVREAARCMTFPDAFIFPADQSMTAVARQIGNAVPPLLARHIANSVAIALDAAPVRARIGEAA